MLAVLALAAVIVFVVHLGVGSYAWYSPGQVLAELFHGPDASRPAINAIVWDIRLQRALAAVLVGGILGGVGSAFQALLRNPLAEPYIVGVSSGAAVGGALVIVLGLDATLGEMGVTGGGLVTGMLSLMLVVALSRRRGVVSVNTLLLAGVVVGTLLSAVLAMVLYMGQRQAEVLSFLLGDLSHTMPGQNVALFATFVVGSALLMGQSRRLNAFALGEDTAQRLGLHTAKLMWAILLTGTAMVAASVGTVGIIGFLGLAAPHISRRLLGVDWRWSLPGSILLGSLLLVVADLIAQRGFSMATGIVGLEMPVGVVTALLGAPSLLILIRRAG